MRYAIKLSKRNQHIVCLAQHNLAQLKRIPHLCASGSIAKAHAAFAQTKAKDQK